MVSIILPLYNKSQHICSTLDSVLRQTYTDFEVIVVDDGSDDDGPQLVNAYSDDRIRLVTQTNQGVSAARNRGIKESKGQFVAFIDADDWWDAHYLETQMLMTEIYPQCDVFATNYLICHYDGNKTEPYFSNLGIYGCHGILKHYFDVASHSSPPLWTSAVMVRRSSIVEIGGFPEEVTSGEDLLTWARLALRCQIAYNKLRLAYYRHIHKVSPIGAPVDIRLVPDWVGARLEEMTASHPEIKGISKYTSFWYKMRAMINLSLGYKRASMRCAIRSLRWDVGNYKNLVIIASILLPTGICRRLTSKKV